MYTDQLEFEKAYKDFVDAYDPANPMPLSVSFEIEETTETDEKETKPFKEESQAKQSRTRNTCHSECDGGCGIGYDGLCETAEKIRVVATDAISRIDERIDSSKSSSIDNSDLSRITDSAICKIKSLIETLPYAFRKELCDSLYEATDKMAENVKSRLIDERYELSKSMELISEQIAEIEEDIDDIDVEISDLEEERDSLVKEIDDNQSEYNHACSKIDAIGITTSFFDELVKVFDI